MIKEDDIILCTVTKIEGTTVFLETEEDVPATMNLSEVAAGRIRNLREYVVPNKKIVCKVLKKLPDHLEVSLRRVTARERTELLERYKKEKAFASMIKASTKEPEKIISKIKEKQNLGDFLDEARDNPSILEKFIPKEDVEALKKVLSEKKEKEKSVTRIITLKSKSNIGDIKEILRTNKADIRYLGSSQFSVKKSGRDFKEAEKEIKEILDEIESKAKEKGAFIELKDKK